MFPTLFSIFALAVIPHLQGDANQAIIREGDHFRFVCHFQNEAAADQGLMAVESAWRVGAKLYDRKRDSSMDLLEVHLYRNVTDYEAADQKLTGGQFQRNQAFAHFATLSAHVAMQPPLSDAALTHIGLPGQTQRLLAHEAAHLVRYTLMPNFEDHPKWLADGAASWIDEQVSRDLGILDAIEDDPNFSRAMLGVQTMLEHENLPSLFQLLHDDTGELEFHARYDFRWAFFHFMLQGKEEKRFLDAVRKVRSIGGGNGFTERYFEELSKIWNEAHLLKVEKSFHAYIKNWEPEWDEIFRNLYFNGEHWIQAAFQSNAIAWRRKPSGERYTLQGELTILPGKKQQMNLFLGYSQEGFFSVAFSAGVGVTLFEYVDGIWNRRAFFPLESLILGESFPFQVDVDGAKVHVSIHGKGLGSAYAKNLDLSGPWGLSAQASSVGIWELHKAPAFD